MKSSPRSARAEWVRCIERGDARLNRDVALKVLPEVFSKDAERMARFEREAQVLASLNHPNIAALYGLEESNGVRALVMELVEGPTLAERLTAGPMPLDEALPIARQLAEGFEYAHEKGVIHRDLKPANVKLTVEGNVKILDFGLAKALDDTPSASSIHTSPTMSLAATRAGVILGTAACMSPEQASGKLVDKRADIWSFGVVLWEMLSGGKLFEAETVAHTLADVLRAEIDWKRLPVGTPGTIRKLIERCLERDAKKRLRDIGEARIVIEEQLVTPSRSPEAAVAPSPHSPSRPVAWIAAAIFAFAALAVSAIHFRETPPAEPHPMRFSVYPPEKTTVDMFSLSPDGRYLAMALSAEGKNALWLRPLNALEAQRLPGTDDARFPFWSPDSRFIGFFAEGKLKKIPAMGGPAQTLCDAATGFGGAWNQDGVIVFTPGNGAPIYRVSAAGGAPAAVAGVESGGGPRFASFLPDGRRFLYTATPSESGQAGIYAGSLSSGPRRHILPDISSAVYAPSPASRNGHVLFVRDDTLMAQPFDPGRLDLSGEPFPIAERVATAARNNVYKRFSVSPAGVLAYWGGRGVTGSQLVWFDRDGKRLGGVGEPGRYSNLALSPDQKRVAVDRYDSLGGNLDVWVMDVERGSASRLTFDPAPDAYPVWSPDGRRIAFSSSREGPFNIYQKSSAGTGSDELVFKPGGSVKVMDWSRDGRYIVYGAQGKGGGYDLWLPPLQAGAAGERKPFPFVQSEFINADAHFSPGGHWLAYASNETGRFEVYVRPVPGAGVGLDASPSAPGAKWQISTAGGQEPVWRGDGKELFYLAQDLRLMAVPITGGSAIEAGVPKALFQTHAIPPGLVVTRSFDVTPDGRRFLINTVSGESEQTPITVVVNWQAGKQ